MRKCEENTADCFEKFNDPGKWIHRILQEVNGSSTRDVTVIVVLGLQVLREDLVYITLALSQVADEGVKHLDKVTLLRSVPGKKALVCESKKLSTNIGDLQNWLWLNLIKIEVSRDTDWDWSLVRKIIKHILKYYRLTVLCNSRLRKWCICKFAILIDIGIFFPAICYVKSSLKVIVSFLFCVADQTQCMTWDSVSRGCLPSETGNPGSGLFAFLFFFWRGSWPRCGWDSVLLFVSWLASLFSLVFSTSSPSWHDLLLSSHLIFILFLFFLFSILSLIHSKF